jgi:hypothetical protein
VIIFNDKATSGGILRRMKSPRWKMVSLSDGLSLKGRDGPDKNHPCPVEPPFEFGPPLESNFWFGMRPLQQFRSLD